MRVEVSIDHTKKLPDGAVGALQVELQKRLAEHFDNCIIVVKRAGSDGLSVTGAGTKVDKERIEGILQETWESADDWFY
ncbi:TPA: DinI-like family protein [Klebsiella pneumoniae]|nr:DinI-like family protein [Klebsiella pneumoniae]